LTKKYRLFRAYKIFSFIQLSNYREIGEEVAKEYNVKYLPSDFKKKNGYKRSVDLSKEHELYRQDYCGCSFSKRESIERAKARENTI